MAEGEMSLKALTCLRGRAGQDQSILADIPTLVREQTWGYVTLRKHFCIMNAMELETKEIHDLWKNSLEFLKDMTPSTQIFPNMTFMLWINSSSKVSLFSCNLFQQQERRKRTHWAGEHLISSRKMLSWLCLVQISFALKILFNLPLQLWL